MRPMWCGRALAAAGMPLMILGTATVASAAPVKPIPTVQSVSPDTGPAGGGSTVTVHGTNFVDVSKVVFGPTAATGVHVVSDTELTAVAPKRGAGGVDVRVTNAAGQSASVTADRYTYVAAPEITSLSPATGSTSGGYVTIKGTALAGVTAVRFGSSDATVTESSDTKITVKNPRHEAGKVTVGVTTPYGTSAANAKSTYTYSPGPPGVTGLTALSRARRVTLSWTNPKNVRGIVVRRADGATPPEGVNSGTEVKIKGTPTSVVDETLLEFRQVSYSVFAKSSDSPLLAGNAPYSEPVSVVRTFPGTVTPGETEPTPGRLTFTWTNPAGVDHALVRIEENRGASIPDPGQQPPDPTGTDIGAAETYTATGLKPYTPYRLVISDFDAQGNTAGDSTIEARTLDGDDEAPDKVTAVQAAAHPTSVDLSWTMPKATDVVGVTVVRGDGATVPTSPTSAFVVGETQYDATTLTDDAAEPGHTYTYALFAIDYTGNYSEPATTKVTTPAGNPPGPVTALTVTAPPPHPDVTGQILDLRWTNPAGAASVLIVRAKGATAPSAVTGDNGWSVPAPTHSFLDTGLPAATHYSYSVWAVAADGTRSRVATVSATTDPNLARPVSGVVRNSVTKQAVAGVPLAITQPDNPVVVRTTSGSDGGYRVALRVGRYSVCADGEPARGGGAAHGYLDTCAALVVTSAASRSLDPLLNPAVAVTGVVTDAQTKQPLPGAVVAVPCSYIYFCPNTKTDANGRYTLTGLDAAPSGGRLTAFADATTAVPFGYVDVSFDYVAKTFGVTVTHNATLARVPVVTVTGRLTSSVGKAPIAGAGVYLVVGPFLPQPRFVTRTKSDGSFRASIGNRFRDSVHVCFDAEQSAGFTNACLGGGDFNPDPESAHDPVRGDATDVRDGQDASMALRPAGVLTGTVRDEKGTALTGVPVVAYDLDRPDVQLTTDAAGRYRVHAPIRPGYSDSAFVCAPRSERSNGNASQAGYLEACSNGVRFTTDNTTGTADVAQRTAAGFTGTVTDAQSGAALAGVLVIVKSGDLALDTGRRATTAADGTWTIAGLDPADSPVSFCFDAPVRPGATSADYPDQCAGGARRAAFTPKAGVVARADTALQRYESVTGVLRGADTGAALPGVEVTISGEHTRTATTDSDGRFTVDRVELGEQNVSVPLQRQGRFGYRAGSASFTVKPGQRTTTELTLQSAAALAVHVVTPFGTPVTGATLVGDSAPFSPLETGKPRTGADGNATVLGLNALRRNTRDFICAYGGTGTGSDLGFTQHCAHLPALVPARTATVTIVVQPVTGELQTAVYDATTRQPLPGARVTYFQLVGSRVEQQQSPSTTYGDGVAYGEFHRSANGPDPLPARWRQCVTADFYRTNCGTGGTEDGSAGPVYTSQRGVRVAAQVPMTKA